MKYAPFVASLASLLFCQVASGVTAQSFVFVGQTTVSPSPIGDGIHGIAFANGQWQAANFLSGWNVYDTSFQQTGQVTTSTPIGSNRAIVFNPADNLFYTATDATSQVYAVDSSGVVQNTFQASDDSFLNAMALDPNSQSLFTVHFKGEVFEYTLDGTLLNSFTVPEDLTGAAYDADNDTLLLLRSGDDHVMEYTRDGVFLGWVVDVESVDNNGQGLHYDASTGLLTVTSQDGDIATWYREPVPEPGSAALLFLGSVTMMRRLRRSIM